MRKLQVRARYQGLREEEDDDYLQCIDVTAKSTRASSEEVDCGDEKTVEKGSVV